MHYCTDITYNMAGAMARAAGLFMAICVLYGTGSSQSVPDGQVYTEVKKTLVVGFPGVLTCRFFGNPVAVYWKKGHDPDDLDLIMLVWYNGEVSGPRYDDRSCDIDENYSLIISNVSKVDAGRIYCIVSNYRGILINNFTDVSVADTAVETGSEEILQMGQGTYGVLQCTVRIKARRVSWKKGASAALNETLVVLNHNENPDVRSGFGYDEGMYNITEDYSLIIKNVQVHHEGLYVCEVTDFDTGISFQSHTFAKVIAYPRKPFPTIRECMKTEQFDSQYCTLEATSEITVTCEVTQYYPEINLFFLHGSTVVEPSERMEWNNVDGTKNKTVTIAARESKEPYTCVASNISGSDERRSWSVLLHDEEKFNSALVIVLVCVAALLILSIMAYFIWRRKHRHSDSNYHDYTQVGQNEQVELQHNVNKDVKDLPLEEYQALLKRVDDALMKHCRRIHDLIDTKSTLHTETVINEIKTTLFNTEQMLNDWRQNLESTYSQYMNAMQAVISTEDTSDNAWPSNEELRWISSHLSQESMEEICEQLKITCKTEGADGEGNMYNNLCKWRNRVAHENIEKKHNLLSSAIGSKKFRGLLRPLKGRFIYKAELVDIGFNLLMQDLLPVTEVLGINATKLVSYRPAFQPTHLEIGTIGLLSKLLTSTTDEFQKRFLDKGNLRILFFTKMGKIIYRNVATCGIVAYDMSYGELYAISEAMTSTKLKAGDQASQGDTSQVPTQSEDDKGEKGAAIEIPENGKKEAMALITGKGGVQAIPGDTSKASTQSENGKFEKGASSNMTHDSKKEEGTDIEKCEGEKPQAGLVESIGNQIPVPEKAVKDIETMDRRAVEIPEDLVDLKRVLQLTDQDIADGLGSSNPITAYALFRIWKEMPRPSVFNYRASLAHELREIQYPDLADEVIAGKYITEQTSLAFIQNMVQGMSQEQLRSLGKLLNLSGIDKHWHTRTPFDEICQQIYEWVTKWTKEMKKPGNVVTAGFKGAWESFKEVTPTDKIKTKSEKHRDLNDKLVEQGFLELAREIMIIELVE